jgi:prepilin peptidase CpaA
MMAPLIEILLLAALLVLLGWACYSDAISFTIPNRISLAVLALYPGHAVLAWPAVDVPGALAMAAAVLAIGFVAFLLGWIGGGDVKLAAALALWAGPERLAELLIVSALAGGLLAVAVLLRAYRRHLRVNGFGSSLVALHILAREPIPYGIALAAGGAYVALRLLPSGAI